MFPAAFSKRWIGVLAVLCAAGLALPAVAGDKTAKSQKAKGKNAKASSRKSERGRPSDQRISDHVEDELLFDEGVDSLQIDVDTNQGVLTLSGSVHNILAKERAARIAEGVKGVRAVVNMIEVEPPLERTDHEIESDIGAALTTNPATDSYEVAAAVDNGKATLSGVVDSWQEKQLAAKVAKGVSGVVGLENDIEVERDAERPDSEIKAEIGQALKWNLLVDHGLIDVSVDDGRVKLSGTVGSAVEKSEAFYTSWVAGVSAVDDQDLTVAKWARNEAMRKNKFAVKTDEALGKAIEDALIYDPRVLAFNIEPEVDGSVVTLRGKVASLQAKRAAEGTARRTVGVTRVVNRLKVRPAERDDERIEREVRAALVRDPYVERFELTVSVVDGVVRLYGDVDTTYEKMRAEDVASDVTGVVEVKNFLTVEGRTYPFVHDPYVDDLYGPEAPYAVEETYTPKTDWEIKEDVESELWWSPFVDSDEVNVTVDDGVATLTGTVSSWSERQSAAENAIEGGAISVHNQLEIAY